MSHKFTIPLLDISENGLELDVDDQDIWTYGIGEFSLDCRIAQPLRAHLSIIRTREGCVVRGTIAGSVVLPCDRCAEEAMDDIDWSFDDFEPMPEGADKEGCDLTETRIISESGNPALDIAALLWEEFLLALPEKPLCRKDCKGLCPVCGRNLNSGPCNCRQDQGDPRLAIFRTMARHR